MSALSPKADIAERAYQFGHLVTNTSAPVRLMELRCQPSRVHLWLLTTNRDLARSLIADIWKRITRLQEAYRLSRYSATTFESRGGLHAHITFIGTRDVANRLKASKQFGDLIDVRPVTDNSALTRKYLAKERTPQAGYRRGHMFGGRICRITPLAGRWCGIRRAVAAHQRQATS
jgi:hypothetical protein